jgi:hypothetical protein
MKIELSKIRTDGGTQSRAALQRNIIDEYADLMKSKVEMPPVDIFHDGENYWLANGYHRFYAKKQISANNEEGFLDEETIDATIYQGTQRDAILFSLGANADHGLRRNDDDKRRAVMTMLNDIEWQQWSNREIAQKCNVSHPFVGEMRKEINNPTGNVTSRTYQRNGKTQTMKVDNIGKHKVTSEKEVVDTETGEIVVKLESTLAVQSELEKCPNTKEIFDDKTDEQSEPSYNVISEKEELAVYEVMNRGKVLDLRTQEGVIEILAESELRAAKEKIASLEKQLEDANQNMESLIELCNFMKETVEIAGFNVEKDEDIPTKKQIINKLKKIKETNNQLFVANKNLTKELNEIKQKNVDFEKDNKTLNNRVNNLWHENEMLKGQIELKPLISSSSELDEMLEQIQSIFEISLEKGVKKGEGIRIGRTNSTELLTAIKQARGVE